MKPKDLVRIIIAGCFLASTAFAQTVQISGTVTEVNGSQIVIQSGTDSWTIKRNSNTKVTRGKLSVGSQVTVECVAPDAQRREAPALTPAPDAGGDE